MKTDIEIIRDECDRYEGCDGCAFVKSNGKCLVAFDTMPNEFNVDEINNRIKKLRKGLKDGKI